VFGFIAADRVYNIVQSDRTSRFPSTQGTLVKSELLPDPQFKEHSQPVVRFDYEISGRITTGHQYRFGHNHSLNSKESAEFGRRFYPGAKVKVLFDPDNPYDAALVGGTDHADLAVFGLFLPFNAASIIFWSIMIRWVWRKLFKVSRGGVATKQRRKRTVVWLPKLTPAGLAAWTIIVGSFVCFVTYLYLPAIPVKENGLACLVWPLGILGAVTCGASLCQAARQHSGGEDLVIGHKTLDLPLNFGRTARNTVAYAQVIRFFVRPRERFYHKFSVTSYEVLLEHESSDGIVKDEKLAEWYDCDKAAEFVHWLTETVGCNP
jgi:hypothetical protein